MGEFEMNAKKAQKLRDILLVSGAVMMACGGVSHWLYYFGIMLACSCLIPHFLYNKCPHCGKQLGRNEGQYCQYCGHPIDENTESS